MATTRQFIERCLQRTPPSIDRTRCISAALLAASEGSGDAGFDRILPDLEGEGQMAFRKAARTLSERWSDNKIRLAFWAPSSAWFTNQILPIAKAASADPRFCVAGVLTGAFDEAQLHGLDWFMDRDFLHAPDPDWLAEIDFFQVMVGSEGRFDRSGFPRSVKRVVPAHGLDAPLCHSLKHFGAGIIYDHVLAPALTPDYLMEMDPDRYLNLFPLDLVEHSNRVVTAIPAGYPKLDEFLKAAGKFTGLPSSIVYHLSDWGLESEFVHQNAARILEALLADFPDHDVIFRPMPTQLNFPEIEAILAPHRGNPRLRISTAQSYVDDYVEAALVIHHQSGSAEIFGLATGRPVLQIVGPGLPRKHPFGFLSVGCEGLAGQVQQLLSSGRCDLPNDGAGRDREIAHRGRAMDYILDALVGIADGERFAEWFTLPLFSDAQPTAAKDRFLQSALKSLSWRAPSRALGREMARRYPEIWSFQFIAAIGLKNDGHPGHFIDYVDAWLDSLECIARCARLQPDLPLGPDLTALFDEWVAEHVPELIAVLAGYYGKSGSETDRSRFESCLASLPLFPDPGAFPETFLKQANSRAARQNAQVQKLAQLASEVVALRLESGIRHLERGDPETGKREFLRALEVAPTDPNPWIGLAHCALVQSDPAGFQASLDRLRREPSASGAVDDLVRIARQKAIAFQ